MTTLRQKLVRKKNRKLRRLRELYPSVNVKLFYARDFRALMLKYGKLALVDGLSGTVRPGGTAARCHRRGRSPTPVAHAPLATPLAASLLGTGRRRVRHAAPAGTAPAPAGTAAAEPETSGR